MGGSGMGLHPARQQAGTEVLGLVGECPGKVALACPVPSPITSRDLSLCDGTQILR